MKCLYPIAERELFRFVLPVINSNMYVLPADGEALIVDPHVSVEAERLLAEGGTKRCTVLLTHEHFDHISGVNRLRELYSCEVICTKDCASALVNPRRNASKFFAALFLGRNEEEQETVKRYLDVEYRCEADTTYEGELRLNWKGIELRLHAAPGHSPGGQLIFAEGRCLFSGDNLVPGERLITRLPGGNKDVYIEQTVPLLHALMDDTVVFPGHGEEGLLGSEAMRFALKESLAHK